MSSFLFLFQFYFHFFLIGRVETTTQQLSLRFNEVLTSTFEYPSESSLCEEIGLSNGNGGVGGTHFDDDDDTDLLYSNGHFLGSSPIGKCDNKIFIFFPRVFVDEFVRNEINVM